MTLNNLRDALVDELIRVAPDLTPADIGDAAHLQNDLGLDSMDFLRFVAALHARLGVDVPESDYRHLATPAEALRYLARRLGQVPPP